jgi:hypothetical protein
MFTLLPFQIITRLRQVTIQNRLVVHAEVLIWTLNEEQSKRRFIRCRPLQKNETIDFSSIQFERQFGAGINC